MIKRFTRIFLFLVSISTMAFAQIKCSQIPKVFNSYSGAVAVIKASKFNLRESINTPQSSWIRGASFYSCDGVVGFLLLKTDKKEYIHADVPYFVWANFKSAASFGQFYDLNIRKHYQLKLNRQQAN